MRLSEVVPCMHETQSHPFADLLRLELRNFHEVIGDAVGARYGAHDLQHLLVFAGQHIAVQIHDAIVRDHTNGRRVRHGAPQFQPNASG